MENSWKTTALQTGNPKQKGNQAMRDSIIMTKYQGLGNDYLVLDANKNQLQLQGKKIALLCQRGFGLGADGVLYGPVDIN